MELGPRKELSVGGCWEMLQAVALGVPRIAPVTGLMLIPAGKGAPADEDIPPAAPEKDHTTAPRALRAIFARANDQPTSTGPKQLGDSHQSAARRVPPRWPYGGQAFLPAGRKHDQGTRCSPHLRLAGRVGLGGRKLSSPGPTYLVGISIRPISRQPGLELPNPSPRARPRNGRTTALAQPP
jgi:hypothetical protein